MTARLVPMFNVRRNPIRGDLEQSFLIFRRPFNELVAHASTRSGANALVKHMIENHIAKRCSCAQRNRPCCDSSGRIPSYSGAVQR